MFFLFERKKYQYNRIKFLPSKTMQFISEVTCPQCSHHFSLSDEFQKDLKSKLNAQLEEKESLWKKEKNELQKASQEKYEKELQLEKVKLWQVAQEKANEKIQSEYNTKLKDLEEQNTENKKRIAEAEQKELDFLKKERELEDKKRRMEIEMEKRILEERKTIEDDIKKSTQEEHRLKLLEKEKQIEQMKKSLEEAQRRSEQGSMQIQGDVQENDLRDTLKQHFPSDSIEDVPTGTRGADLIQRVTDVFGNTCGIILWESKNTKAWNEAWIQKLKDDQGEMGADISILISKSLPEGVSHYEMRNGVWVVSYALAIELCTLLRFHLLEVGKVKKSLQGQDEKMQILFEYLSSPQFKNRIENIVGAFTQMKTDLDKEKRAMQTIWNRREKELERVVMNTSGLYGDLQGISGNALSPVEQLELLEHET